MNDLKEQVASALKTGKRLIILGTARGRAGTLQALWHELAGVKAYFIDLEAVRSERQLNTLIKPALEWDVGAKGKIEAIVLAGLEGPSNAGEIEERACMGRLRGVMQFVQNMRVFYLADADDDWVNRTFSAPDAPFNRQAVIVRYHD